MIEQTKVELIKRLLAEDKLSQRKIAKQAGVSRATVASIADGSRPDYSARPNDPEFVFDEEPTGPPVRCPGCGGLVYGPCRLCRVRRLKAEENRNASAAGRLPLAGSSRPAPSSSPLNYVPAAAGDVR